MPNKAVAAGGAVGVSGALAHLITVVWFPHADPSVAIDLTTILAALGAIAGAYFPKMEGQ